MKCISGSRFSLLVGLLVLTSCDQGPKHSSVGSTPLPSMGIGAGELHSELGEPTQVDQSKLQAGTTLETFKGSPETYQVTGGKVFAAFRQPQLEESQIQFWLQRWKDTLVVKIPVESSKSHHGIEKIQYRAPKLKESVVYEVNTQQVVEIIRHAE